MGYFCNVSVCIDIPTFKSLFPWDVDGEDDNDGHDHGETEKNTKLNSEKPDRNSDSGKGDGNANDEVKPDINRIQPWVENFDETKIYHNSKNPKSCTYQSCTGAPIVTLCMI